MAVGGGGQEELESSLMGSMTTSASLGGVGRGSSIHQQHLQGLTYPIVYYRDRYVSTVLWHELSN